ncbi:hypothetical protein V6R21_04325 [Limibacter armeniacum]|uniref:hypothetical protein n=1 Tax=Limibacter armeniacum TaxID=466084 RepID=UPI002FE562D2
MLIKSVKQIQPPLMFIDSVYFKFNLLSHIQDWVDNEIIPPIAASSTEKMAFCKSFDLVSQILIEETMDQPISNSYLKVKYFYHKEAAIKWLLKDGIRSVPTINLKGLPYLPKK